MLRVLRETARFPQHVRMLMAIPSQKEIKEAIEASGIGKNGYRVEFVEKDGQFVQLSQVLEASYKNMCGIPNQDTQGVSPMSYIEGLPNIAALLLERATIPHLMEMAASRTDYALVFREDKIFGVFGLDSKPYHAPKHFPFDLRLMDRPVYRLQQFALHPSHIGKGNGHVLMGFAKQAALHLDRDFYMGAPAPKVPRLTSLIRVPHGDYFIKNVPFLPGHHSWEQWNSQWLNFKGKMLQLNPRPEQILLRQWHHSVVHEKFDRGFLISDYPSTVTLFTNFFNDYPMVGQKVKIPDLWRVMTFNQVDNEDALKKVTHSKLKHFKAQCEAISAHPEFKATCIIPPKQLQTGNGQQIPILMTTADPVHLGHIEAIVTAAKQTDAPYGMIVLPLSHPTKTPKDLESRLVLLETIQHKYPWIGVSICNQGEWKSIFPNMKMLLLPEDQQNSQIKVVNVLGSDKLKCLQIRDRLGFQSVPHIMMIRHEDSVSSIRQQVTLGPNDRIIDHPSSRVRYYSSTRIRNGEKEGMYKLLVATRNFLRNLETMNTETEV